MAVDSLLASAPLTLTRQIVEQTSQTLDLVRENVDKVLLEGPDAEEKSLARPGTQPVGAAKDSSETGPQGQKDGKDDSDQPGNGGNADDSGFKTPFRGNTVNAQA